MEIPFHHTFPQVMKNLSLNLTFVCVSCFYAKQEMFILRAFYIYINKSWYNEDWIFSDLWLLLWYIVSFLYCAATTCIRYSLCSAKVLVLTLSHTVVTIASFCIYLYHHFHILQFCTLYDTPFFFLSVTVFFIYFFFCSVYVFVCWWRAVYVMLCYEMLEFALE